MATELQVLLQKQLVPSVFNMHVVFFLEMQM